MPLFCLPINKGRKMGNAQANTRVSDMVYAATPVLDCTLLKKEDAVALVTKEELEIDGITNKTKDRKFKYDLPPDTEVTFGRIIRFGFKSTERICAIIGDNEGNIRFLNPGKGNMILKLPCSKVSSIPGEGHEGSIVALEKLENDYIATGGVDGSVRIWEVNKGIQERVFLRPDYMGRADIRSPSVTALCYCPPSALAAYSSSSFSASLAVSYSDGQIWVYGLGEDDRTAMVLTTNVSDEFDERSVSSPTTNNNSNNNKKLNFKRTGLPATSLSYLSNEMILGAATGEKLLVWNMRFIVKSNEYKQLESNGMLYNAPICPSTSLSINACKICLFGTYTLAGPWPETPIVLCGCNDGHVSAWALSDTPEFDRCEILPVHTREGFGIFSGPISVLRNNSAELQSVLVASGCTVVLLAQQTVAGGISSPSLGAAEVVERDDYAYNELDENGVPIRNPNNVVVPLQKNKLEEEMIAYIDSHPECIDAYLDLLRSLSYKLHDGVSPTNVKGIVDEPDTPGKLLDDASARLSNVFKQFAMTMPQADGSKYLNKDSNLEILQDIVNLTQKKVEKNNSSHKKAQKTLSPVVDASSTFVNAAYGTDAVKRIAEAALNVKLAPVPEDNGSYDNVVKAQSENLYVEAMNTAKRLEKQDVAFAKIIDDICHIKDGTAQDDSDESKDIDIISCLLDKDLGIKRLAKREEHLLKYTEEKHKLELELHDERMEKKIKQTQEKFDGERRFWAARFNLAIEFHRILRLRAAQYCKESIYNAIVKSLPNGTVSGSRYVTLPLYENPLDFDDKKESKEDPSNLLYPAFDLKERKLVASRIIPTGVVSKEKLGRFKYKYILPCIDISPSISDNHQEYVITEVPPTMNLLKGYTNDKCLFPVFPENAAARFVYKLIEALASLIERGKQIVHRDIRPSTIMLRYRGGKQVKLRNTKPKEENPEEEKEKEGGIENNQNIIPIADNVKFKKIEPVIFTVGFMRGPKLNDPLELNTVFSSPEVICGGITKTSDVWSTALLLIKMLEKPASECAGDGYPRENAIFCPVGVPQDLTKRWDISRPDEVRNSLLSQMITFCTDIPYNAGEFPPFIAMSFLNPLNLRDSEFASLYSYLTGKVLDEVDMQFAVEEYEADVQRGMTIESYMINSGLALNPDEINPNVRSLLPASVSEECVRLLSKCLSFFPTRRPTLEHLLTADWFKQNGVKLDHEMALRVNGGYDKERVTKDGVVIGSRMGYKEKVEEYK